MNDGPKPRIRFGLKSLLVATTLFAILLASLTYPLIDARRQQVLINRAAALGARVSNLAFVTRPMSLGRSLLSVFSNKFSFYYCYGLDFSGTSITDDELEWVAQIEQVKELNLSGTMISDVGLKHLRGLQFLTKLVLSNTRLTDNAIDDLRTLDYLASLDTNGTAVSYAALAKLDSQLKYAHFSEERAIDELKAVGIQIVATPRFLEGEKDRGAGTICAGREAHHVIVGMNRPATLNIRDVENLSHLTSLDRLIFHTVTVGSDGLTGFKTLPELKDLEIWFVNLTDRDVANIARQTHLQKLTIYGCDQVTDDGIEQLKTLKDLKQLRIYGRRITKKALTQLKVALPNCDVSGAS